MTNLLSQMEVYVKQKRNVLSLVGQVILNRSKKFSTAFVLFVAIGLSACSHAGGVNDPMEGMNRKIHTFNDKFDTYLLKPVAKGYVYVTPKFVQTGVNNFFDNLGYPLVAVNQALQGKGRLAVQDTVRFALNTTVGVAGLFDVAKNIGLEKHEEDFGQTFAAWGIESSPYLVVPFWGPTTLRDGLGSITTAYTHPLSHVEYFDERKGLRTGLLALSVIDKRARLLDAEKLLSGDKYLFMRDAYLQRRDYLINDGAVEEDPFLDDEE